MNGKDGLAAVAAEAVAASEAAEVALVAEASEAVAAEALQLQALLLSRGYLYELFHKLLGGTPDGEVLAALTNPATADVLDEFADGNEALSGFAQFLQGFAAAAAEDGEGVLSAVRDEYTRVLVGPAELPASPYESPYTGAHDMALFQENTLAVRATYREQGLQPRRIQAVPDDHVALMCGFMAQLAARAEALLADGVVADGEGAEAIGAEVTAAPADLAALAATLREQGRFVRTHMVPWLPTYAEAVRNSRAGAQAVLYPQLLEGLAAFVAADADFLAEAAYWAESQEGAEGEAAGESASASPAVDAAFVAPAPQAADPFAPVREALAALQATRPFGIQDNELISLD